MIKVGNKTTMTIQELIWLLEGMQDKSMPVFATWEGVFAGIQGANFELTKLNDRIVLAVDVEDYHG